MSTRFLSALLACFVVSAQAAPLTVREQLSALANQQGFVVEGLSRLQKEPAPTLEQGTAAEQIKDLLRDYNYLAIERRPGVIEKILITSRKSDSGAKSADSAYIATTRLGAHHQVQAMLAGPNAVAKTVTLLIDTGASTLVLPASMIPELGFSPDTLRKSVSQTASGTVPIQVGTLASVRIGAVALDNVEVGFIADQKLNGAMLLGMSFLGKFRMTIDDARNELVLIAK